MEMKTKLFVGLHIAGDQTARLVGLNSFGKVVARIQYPDRFHVVEGSKGIMESLSIFYGGQVTLTISMGDKWKPDELENLKNMAESFFALDEYEARRADFLRREEDYLLASCNPFEAAAEFAILGALRLA